MFCGRTCCFIPLTQAAFGCAPLGRTSCGAQSRLPQHLRASEEFITSVIPVKTGIQCQQVRCMPPSMDSRFRENDEGKKRLFRVGERPAEGGKAVRPQNNLQPKAAGVSGIRPKQSKSPRPRLCEWRPCWRRIWLDHCSDRQQSPPPKHQHQRQRRSQRFSH